MLYEIKPRKFMCLSVFLASDIELPAEKWSEDKAEIPFIYFETLPEDVKEQVASKFSKPKAYYVGTNSICSCGLHFNDWYLQTSELDDEDKADIVLKKCTYELLKDSLINSKSKTGFEIFVCWEGDQALEPIAREKIQVTDIDKNDFYFKEGYLYHVQT